MCRKRTSLSPTRRTIPVALQYDENKMSAESGREGGWINSAAHSRDRREHRVPHFRTLAQALYRHAEIGQLRTVACAAGLPLRKCWRRSGSLNAGGLRAGNVLPQPTENLRCQKRWILANEDY